ncbi:MAG: trypsin-like peptidase domain-containing protein, partial [Myxococcota bacterium]|nr:trypsin-like peptidase domain-containing protein [Myxococcota bacterium]
MYWWKFGVLILLFGAFGSSQAAADQWESTLERVVPAVVSLQVSSTRAFDTESASSSQGTGFVVDAENGILLTNRHMVEPGPVVSQAVFQNHEEVDVQALYRDPVHDFGFYRFDPAEVRFLELSELPLVPEAAKVGVEIRVIGNDAGEKISILSGTLARLDRAAPRYSGNGYNDFNTFYYQAASSTSGGSSGSPVVDVQGRVLALNAGGSMGAASSFYLPLQRVVRALDLVREGKPVSRGTLRTIFHYTAFDELRRLGLTDETETLVRESFPDGTGMQVVRQVVPGGSAEGALLPGDILVRVGGELVTGFLPLEAKLDDSVGETLAVEVERGGEKISLQLTVEDLHAITPDEFLEMGGGIVHELSYQQARNHVVPVEGLYVATPGFTLGAAGVPDGALLREVDGKPVATLDDFWEALIGKSHGDRVPLRYASIRFPRRNQVTVLEMDRLWFDLRRCKREDTTGLWPCIDAPPAPEAVPPEPATTTFAKNDQRAQRALERSLVVVEFDIPYRTEGSWGSHFRGGGLVVDAEKGLVVVDRDTVPIPLGNLSLTFGGSVKVPGKVEFVHPVHDFA